jgi:hypothetical protein
VRLPGWMKRAACTPHIQAGDDWWHPDDEMPRRVQQAMFAVARGYCVGCPVQVQCGRYGMELLARESLDGMYGGMDPSELRDLARLLGMPARKVAQHGTRARYVNFRCRCGPCTRANSEGEAERRSRIAFRTPVRT